jgi:hypothetical protein
VFTLWHYSTLALAFCFTKNLSDVAKYGQKTRKEEIQKKKQGDGYDTMIGMIEFETAKYV